MLIPLMWYLAQTTSKKWVKYGMWAAIAACAFSILGSHSRGAFLAIGVATLFLGIKSGRPIVFTIGLVLALAGAVTLMPDNWIDRMGTIESYRSDASAVSRLQTWETIWNMVIRRPIVGAGFDLANPQLFQTYSPYPDMEAYAPHSIYFVLGETASAWASRVPRPGPDHLASQQETHWRANLPGLEWVPLRCAWCRSAWCGGRWRFSACCTMTSLLSGAVVLVEVADRQQSEKRDGSRPGFAAAAQNCLN
jgi:hypothetical protein